MRISTKPNAVKQQLLNQESHESLRLMGYGMIQLRFVR
jgi:hypothetical protein